VLVKALAALSTFQSSRSIYLLVVLVLAWLFAQARVSVFLPRQLAPEDDAR